MQIELLVYFIFFVLVFWALCFPRDVSEFLAKKIKFYTYLKSTPLINGNNFSEWPNFFYMWPLGGVCEQIQAS